MSRDNSISLKDFSNFLESGAFLRHGSEFYLVAGPFQNTQNKKNQEISIYCPEFYEFEKHTLKTGVSTFCISRMQVDQCCREFLNQNSASIDLSKISWSKETREDFNISFARIQNLISQGQIEKAVPTTSCSAQFKVTASERAQMLLHLLDAPESLHLYGFWEKENGIIGATPEVLFIRKQKELSTMALAGTLAKGGSHQSFDLLKDPKEIHEHRVVIEDIVQQLNTIGEVTTRGPELLDLPTLWHLKTEINVELNDEIDFVNIVNRLHPTPALGCAPRSFGWRWMQELSGQKNRGRFGAPFAFLIGQELQICLVAIRNLQWTKNEAKIFAGCGVVQESQADREWLELDRKTQSVLSILGFQS